MTADDAFLLAILEQPDDDGPRLMYADWLEERGDPRGEFIRVQCALAGTSPDDPQRPHWETVERELLTRHRTTWLGPLHSLAYCWQFRRGFAEEVAVEASAFLLHASLFFSRTPLRLARLLRVAWHIRELAHGASLGRLTALHLTDSGIGNEGVAHLAASRHISRLTTLRLGHTNIGDAGAGSLADSPYLKQLTTLTLNDNHIGDAGASALASSPNLSALTALHLRDNYIGPAGVERILTSPHLTRLETLDLGNTASHRSGGNRISPVHRMKLRERFPGAAVLC